MLLQKMKFIFTSFCCLQVTVWAKSLRATPRPLKREDRGTIALQLRQEEQGATSRQLQLEGQVNHFRLINADTNQPIDGFDPILNGDTINLASLPTWNLNVQAVASGTISSVTFAFDTNKNFRTESAAPYALCGDGGGDYVACPSFVFGLGSHSVTATPNNVGPNGAQVVVFTVIDQAEPLPTSMPSLTQPPPPIGTPSMSPSLSPSGVALPSSSPTFIASASPTPSPSSFSPSDVPSASPRPSALPSVSSVPSVSPSSSPISSLEGQVTQLRLMNADTDLPLEGFDPMSNNCIINLATLPTWNLNVQAVTSGTISSVTFAFDTNKSFRTESTAPYALCGDGGGDYVACPSFVFGLGSHSVTATPNNVGSSGALIVLFTVIDQAGPLPTSTPSLSPTTTSQGPTGSPNSSPSQSPSDSSRPSILPSASPNQEPSDLPSTSPVGSPSIAPSTFPSLSMVPSVAPNLSSKPSFLSSGTPTTAVMIPNLYYSLSSDRSNPIKLDGQTLTGHVWIFTDLAFTDVAPVTFRIDGEFSRIENGYPYDLVGGAAYNVNQLSDTFHTMTAESYVDGSLVIASATFLVFDPTALPRLSFSPESLSFDVFAAGTSPVSQAVLTATDDAMVMYNIDTSSLPSWLVFIPDPADDGLTPLSSSISVDVSGLPPGLTDTVVVEALGPAGGVYLPGTLTVTVRVSGPEDFYEQLHLAWVGDTSTTMNILWATYQLGVESIVQFRPVGTSVWLEETGGIRDTGTLAGEMHEVALTGLIPATEYEYRVMVQPNYGMLSSIFTFRTAGAAEFSAIYVADTGLDGAKSDGAVERLLLQIEELKPLLLIPGGDYAYWSDEQGRYPLLDGAIDAWFRMVEPISRGRPLMPTYGNHEDHILENYEDWARRFPTPEGHNNRRCYSFDVNGVHFISLYVVHPNTLNAQTYEWLKNDLTAASNDPTVRWIIPYLHQPIFGDGKNHPPSSVLRNQVAPLFEQNGVPVVFSAHDQAYERSYALVNTGGGNEVRSSDSTRCYSTQNNDGVVFAKVSPGGRGTNRFSPFANDPAPAWTASRENTHHHFSEIIFRSDGSIFVNSWGVEGGAMGQTTLDDWFEYRTDACPK